MPAKRVKADGSSYQLPHAATPELLDLQLQAAAYKLVGERLANGTASAQETIYFLKASSRREEAEVARIEAEVKLAEAKVKQMELDQNQASLLEKAVEVFTTYRPSSSESPDENVF